MTEGQGFTQLMAQLVQERLIIGAQAVGAMERAVHETIRYTKQRHAFGHSLFEFQNTAFELAECQTIARTGSDRRDRRLVAIQRLTIGAYVGLVPCEYSSGTARVQGPITKAGNTQLRRR